MTSETKTRRDRIQKALEAMRVEEVITVFDHLAYRWGVHTWAVGKDLIRTDRDMVETGTWWNYWVQSTRSKPANPSTPPVSCLPNRPSPEGFLYWSLREWAD